SGRNIHRTQGVVSTEMRCSLAVDTSLPSFWIVNFGENDGSARAALCLILNVVWLMLNQFHRRIRIKRDRVSGRKSVGSLLAVYDGYVAKIGVVECLHLFICRIHKTNLVGKPRRTK